MSELFDQLQEEAGLALTERAIGRVSAVRGLSVFASSLPAPIGARCRILTRRHGVRAAEIVGTTGDRAVLTVYGEITGVSPDDPVECVSGPPRVAVGWDLLGRVLNARGEPIDGRAAPLLNRRYPLERAAPAPLERREIDEPLALGVRSIDGLLTAGRGQRLGIFAGAGVGKSVLMGMICRNTAAQVNVVALIGERGREVGDFLRHQLGETGLARSVVVVCTSDDAAAARIEACYRAQAIAEFFRDQGQDVLLLVDSLTRVAMGQRQIGLAAGEPPTSKGYPPSVFALLPRLLERAGRTQQGSITGLYTVLVEGDDLDDPLSDAARSILDGHIVLSRKLANRGHFPAVDVLASISRVATDVQSADHRKAAGVIRRLIADWREIEDLVSIGAYAPGSNRAYDLAFKLRDAVEMLLRQSKDDRCELAETLKAMGALEAATRG